MTDRDWERFEDMSFKYWVDMIYAKPGLRYLPDHRLFPFWRMGKTVGQMKDLLQ